MANVSSILVWEHADPLTGTASGRKEVARQVINALEAATSGSRKAGGFDLFPNGTVGVAASGTITLATCLTGTEIEVNGVKFRAITSGTPTIANGEFVISGTDTADATSLVAAINGSTNAAIAGLMVATSALGVVTVTATQKGALGNGISIKTNGVVAKGTVTVASITANDTVTINGTALTSKQQRATGTLTAATAVAGNTFSINGNTFVGKAGASTLGSAHFSIDTSDTATGTDIVAQINAFAPLSGVVTATNAAGVVTVRAVVAGTGGNSIALAGTATVLAASAAALSAGIAVANNEFEAIGTDTQIAADLVRAIGVSSTALVSSHVSATNQAGVVTLWANYAGTPGNQMTLASSNGGRLAVSAARLAGGVEASSLGVAATADITFASCAAADTITIGGVVFTAHATVEAANQFEVSGSDTADAASACKMINNSVTALANDIIATSAAAVLTITARRGGISGNAITIATSTGVRLAITGGISRLATGAVPVTVALSAARLTAGVGGSVTKIAHGAF